MRDEYKTPAQLKGFIKKNNGKKTNTLRQNVLRPLLITIAVISIVMLVFFNIVISIMLYSGVVSDLNSISASIEQLSQTDEKISENEQEILKLYRNEVDRRSVSYSINMVIFSEKNEIVKSVTPLNTNIETVLKEEGFQKCKENKLFSVKTEDDIFIVKPIGIENSKNESALVYASLYSLWSTLKWSNSALLVIIVLSVLGFIVASNIIAHKISKPIKELSDHMELIGDGDFTPVKITDNSIELQKLMLSINEMLARLEAYNKAHTVSIQNLSHDLRTPLMSISGYAEGIKYGVLDDTDEACDVIIKESKRLTNVVEKMLILSELDTLHQPVNMVPIKLAAFLSEEVKGLEGYAIQNNIKIKYIYDNNDTKVLADKQLFSTIIRNIISNGIRYAEKELEINFFTEKSSTYVCIADDGQGLSDNDLKYLFVRYYVGKTGHTGLGLSTAKGAAEYMGCQLSGKNRNTLPQEHPCYGEHGAVFTLAFPKY